MGGTLSFALNHMCAPSLGYEAFFDLASDLGLATVEIRNDLAGQATLDGTPAAKVGRAAHERGIRIASINALQRFNEWNTERAAEAATLIRYTQACGAGGLVLVPVNDGTGRANGERQANLRIALKALAPMLRDAGVTGIVEPLGFAECSLRSKAEAVEAIRSTATEGVFALVHDTFHHHLAGEPQFFTAMTRLVHISGVANPNIAVSEMRDPHRGLVDRGDRLGNLAQIRALLDGGYGGPLSFEPFSPSVHGSEDIAGALRASMRHIGAEVLRPAP